MKKALLFFALIYSANCFAQSNRPPIAIPAQNVPFAPPVNLTTDDEWFKDRRVNHYWEESYIINGRKVLGTPFLYRDWENGVIITADGREYSGYKIKYDAFHQTVYFHNGNDSLEVDEEIREFKLVIVYPDTITTSVFVNANQFAKEKKTFYFEVLLDGSAGKLLKYNKKIMSEANKNIPIYEGKKFFDLEVSYFYYDKNKKLVTPIKANGSNIESILTLDEFSKAILKNYDFSLENDLIGFFKKYFEQSKSK